MTLVGYNCILHTDVLKNGSSNSHILNDSQRLCVHAGVSVCAYVCVRERERAVKAVELV